MTPDPKNEHTALYFAYGSNLCREQMKTRCPTALPVARASLFGWQLVFKGVADVVRQKGATVRGALYRVTDDDIAALDVFEGVAHNTYRRVGATLPGWNEPCFFYVMSRQTIWPPQAAYLARIERGYDDWRICRTGLAEAVRAATLVRDETLLAFERNDSWVTKMLWNPLEAPPEQTAHPPAPSFLTEPFP